MKRIASIQDISCIGKCSQTIAIPILSVMGLECAAIPTAMLSVHTAFDSFYHRDLTDSIAPIADHWKSLGLTFDGIYTGYLSSYDQVAQVLKLIDSFSAPLLFVDPAMADHGRLYAGLPADFPEHMAKLCKKADVLAPNVTETCLLTGLPYRELHEEAYIRELLQGLASLCPGTAIITGIRPNAQEIGVAYLGSDGRMKLRCSQYVPTIFHGTGDLFSATAAGALTLGSSPGDAVSLAMDYVSHTIRMTVQDPDARWYGVSFETTLSYLFDQLQRRNLR